MGLLCHKGIPLEITVEGGVSNSNILPAIMQDSQEYLKNHIIWGRIQYVCDLWILNWMILSNSNILRFERKFLDMNGHATLIFKLTEERW